MCERRIFVVRWSCNEMRQIAPSAFGIMLVAKSLMALSQPLKRLLQRCPSGEAVGRLFGADITPLSTRLSYHVLECWPHVTASDHPPTTEESVSLKSALGIAHYAKIGGACLRKDSEDSTPRNAESSDAPW
jgi:hypothetical protein